MLTCRQSISNGPNSTASGTIPLLQTNNHPEAVIYRQALRTVMPSRCGLRCSYLLHPAHWARPGERAQGPQWRSLSCRGQREARGRCAAPSPWRAAVRWHPRHDEACQGLLPALCSSEDVKLRPRPISSPCGEGGAKNRYRTVHHADEFGALPEPWPRWDEMPNFNRSRLLGPAPER
jgi:hypothetical protein